jgi:hypothetical protein
VIDQVVRELKADRRKLSAMVILTGFALLLWGRLLLKNVPQTATARPVAKLLAAGETDKNEAPVDLAKPLPVVYVDLAEELPRDLFGRAPSPYNRSGFTQISPSGAKFEPEQTDEPTRPAWPGDSAGLTLQSVLVGARPRAVINGVVVAPGQQVAGFTLVRVSGREAILGRNGTLIRLRM